MTDEPEVQETEGDEERVPTESEVKGLRQEAASRRVALRESEKQVENLTAKLQKYANADKSELERLTEEKVALETQLINYQAEMEKVAVDTAIKLSAASAEVVDVEAITKLIDRSEIVCDEGQVSGVEKALKRLLKDKPYLGKEPTPPPAPGTGGQPLDGSDVNGLDNALSEMFKGAAEK